jgi:hypothetical protein
MDLWFRLGHMSSAYALALARERCPRPRRDAQRPHASPAQPASCRARVRRAPGGGTHGGMCTAAPACGASALTARLGAGGAMGKSRRRHKHPNTGYPYTIVRVAQIHVVRPKARHQAENGVYIGAAPGRWAHLRQPCRVPQPCSSCVSFCRPGTVRSADAARRRRAGLLLEATVEPIFPNLPREPLRRRGGLKRLDFVRAYGEFWGTKAASVYRGTRSLVPHALDASLRAVEDRVAGVGLPLLLRSEHALGSVDTTARAPARGARGSAALLSTDTGALALLTCAARARRRSGRGSGPAGRRAAAPCASRQPVLAPDGGLTRAARVRAGGQRNDGRARGAGGQEPGRRARGVAPGRGERVPVPVRQGAQRLPAAGARPPGAAHLAGPAARARGCGLVGLG